MVALQDPVRHYLEADAFVGDSPLWAAVCHTGGSKPGFPSTGSECWTLISTPDFAVQQIQETAMRDRSTGAFCPQQNDYLNTIPGPILLASFTQTIESLVPSNVLVKAVYLQAQRWGSGLPAPRNEFCRNVINIDGLDYVSQVTNLVYPRDEEDSAHRDFVANDSEKLYYAGDFCSLRCPGFEAAALSGFDLAQHILTTI
jgi:predicted NAD/FAD-dependent oxidoreductase